MKKCHLLTNPNACLEQIISYLSVSTDIQGIFTTHPVHDKSTQFHSGGGGQGRLYRLQKLVKPPLTPFDILPVHLKAAGETKAR